MSQSHRTSSRTIAAGVLIAITYVFAARLGFTVAFVAEQVTTVWAPTGIAQAALLIWGRRLWPAVWLGAFIVNLGAAAPWWTAVLIATGNTLEAVALAWLLPRARFDPALSRFGDAARLIVIGAGVTTAISATIGVVTLCGSGVQPWSRASALWAAWWLGDALGSIVIAPVLLTIARASYDRSPKYWWRTAMLVAITLVTTEFVFGNYLRPLIASSPLHYVLFPLVVVAAVRLGQPATGIVVLAASTLAIMHTVVGEGPFASADIYQGLVLLQAFTGVLAGTGLLLAAAMTERQTIQRRVTAAYGVSDVLAHAADLPHAAPILLQRVCEALGWQFGAIWLIDADAKLRALATWAESPALDPFTRATSQAAFERGSGLPGRVWSTGTTVWLEDAVRDANFPRAPAAAQAGLHGGFGFPIRLGNDVLGVIEFFTRRIAAPDHELLETMSSIGSQVGQYVSRKQVEQSIRLSEERFRTLASSATTLTLYEHDRDLRYRWVFPQHPEFFTQNAGKTDVELLGNVEGQRLMAIKQKVLDSGIGCREEVTVTLQGEAHTYDLMVEPRRDANGAVIGVAGVAIDVTERKRHEQLLRDSREQLREADRRKDEFLAMLAHELRNPLAPIRTGLEYLRVSGNDPSAIDRVRPMMERQIGHMVRLIDDLLDVSRITSGKIHLQKVPARLADLVAAAIDGNKSAIDAAGLDLVVDIPDRPVILHVDTTRFVQVLSNLLHNAAKFTAAPGRVTIKALVQADARGDMLLLSVSDTGIGIVPTLLPYIFDLFTQGEHVDPRHPAGLGIGLALVKKIVDLHGGTIVASSEGHGKGSSFTVCVPVVAAAVDSDQRRDADQPRRRLDRRVLVVDDNDDSAEMLALLVRSLGGEARTANDGALAIRLATEFAPDVVLLDIGMPGMDGYETCRHLREQAAGKNAFIVALTGWGQERDKLRAMEAGFDAHLTKPADPSEIERLLMAVREGFAPSTPRSGGD